MLWSEEFGGKLQAYMDTPPSLSPTLYPPIHPQVNNGTHEITSTCTTIVRDMAQSPKNPAPKGNKDDAAAAAVAVDVEEVEVNKQEAAVTVPAPAAGGAAAAQAAVCLGFGGFGGFVGGGGRGMVWLMRRATPIYVCAHHITQTSTHPHTRGTGPAGAGRHDAAEPRLAHRGERPGRARVERGDQCAFFVCLGWGFVLGWM